MIHDLKKIIFLDIDGVLNCEIDDIQNEFEDISKRCVKMLNTIIKETDAKVVISSVWRNNRTVDQLQELLEKYGFEGEVVSKTPHLGKEV